MRNLRVSVVLLLLCFSAPSKAAVNGKQLVPAEFSRRIVSSSNWKALLRKVDSRLPPNVLKELTDIAERTEFPDITYFRSEIHIRDANGSNLKVTFGAQGKVYFNDIAWSPRPLAKTSDEVARIADFISNPARDRSALLNYFDPVAFAFPAATGVALAAQSSAAGWQAESCGANDLSADQNRTCPLMLVAMRSPALPNDPAMWVPVSLVCPTPKDNGPLSLLSENQNGEAQKITFVYKSGKPVTFDLLTAEKNKPFDLSKRISADLVNGPDGFGRKMGTVGLLEIGPIFSSVCDGPPDAKARYDATAKANRDALRQADPDNFQPNVPGRSGLAI